MSDSRLSLFGPVQTRAICTYTITSLCTSESTLLKGQSNGINDLIIRDTPANRNYRIRRAFVAVNLFAMQCLWRTSAYHR